MREARRDEGGGLEPYLVILEVMVKCNGRSVIRGENGANSIKKRGELEPHSFY